MSSSLAPTLQRSHIRSILRGGSKFEPLEPRQLLSVSATMDSTTVTPTEWLLVVHYRSDASVDLSSLGNTNLLVTAPATFGTHSQPAYSQFARLWEAPRPQQDGSVIQVYSVTAPGGAWDWADTGHYRVTLQAGQVRDTTGATAPTRTLTDNFLWFTTPRAEVTMSVVGGSGWQVAIWYSDDVGIDSSTIVSGNIEVHGPRGLLSIATLNYISNQADGSFKAYYTAKIAQVSASYLNNGSYDFYMRPGEVLDTSGYAIPYSKMGSNTYGSTNPAVQLVSSNMRTNDWLVQVRYSDDTGIQLSSVGAVSGDVRAIAGSSPLLGVITGSPQVSSDGSVLATYSIAAPAGGWHRVDGAYHLDYYGTGHVRDLQGNSITGGNLIATTGFSPSNPTASVASSSRISPSVWQVTVNFQDDASLNQFSLLSGTALEVVTLGGFRSTLTVVSSTQTSAGGWQVTYRMTASGSAFVPGSYYLRTVAFGVLDNAGHSMPSSELLAFTL